MLRPVLEIELLGPALAPEDAPPRVAALVDSGAERTFAAPWLARAIGVDLHDSPEIRVGLGGATRRVQFADVTLRLIAPDETTAVEWQADVGFIASWEPPWGLLLGQRGFFDRCTVTLNRFAQGFAVEDVDVFEQRFDVMKARSRAVTGTWSGTTVGTFSGMSRVAREGTGTWVNPCSPRSWTVSGRGKRRTAA